MSKQGRSSVSGNNLLEEFSAPTLKQWREEVERLLKGAPFAKKMFTNTVEGLPVSGMYTKVDTDELPWAENLPGQWPNLRGNQAAGEKSNAWMVAQEILLPTAEEFNHALRSDLRRGQTAVNLVLDKAGLKGMDPDQCPAELVGAQGTSIASMADLEVALDGVDLETTALFLQTGSAALPVTALLLAMLKKRGKYPNKLSGCLGSDPVFGLAEMGQLPLELGRLYDELATISRWSAQEAPALKTLPVHEDPWHDGGADSALSLALVLASAVQMLKAMQQRGLDPETAAARIQFNLCIGSDFFMEIAKVRALRLLWSDILDAAGCPEVASSARIHARTSRRTQSRLDLHVNMLRVTTQAMSAVFGGVDSLHVSPFDEVDSVPDEFSRRIARNVQLMLSHECHFDQVRDAAGGSWYVESLTRDLAEKAWGIFQEIEAGGGIIEGMKTGWVQDRVEAAAELRKSRLATRKDVLVGTNQYADPLETKHETRQVDHSTVHACRAEVMKKMRISGAQDEHMLVLGRLEKIMDAESGDLLALLCDAATHGATLGELTDILRHDTDPGLSVRTIELRRDAEPFEDLRRQVAALQSGGRVFAMCLGDVARYMPRLDFTRGFFQVGGFEVLELGSFTSAFDAVKAADESGALVVMLVGLDKTYDDLGAVTLKGLRALSHPPISILAGGSADQLAELNEAGLDQSINMRSNILDVLGKLAQDLGGQS